MKPFKMIIYVDARGTPSFRFDPNEPHSVASILQLLQIVSQIVGNSTIGGNRGEKKDGGNTKGKEAGK
jgi:hypothetical protein